MPRFLTLDADAGGLFVAAGGTARGGALAVEHTLAAADDLGPLTPANAAARGARLKELLAAAAVKPAPLLVLVGRDRVILKDVTHPPTSPADEPAVVRFQASRDLTDAADDVVMDYLPLAPAADGQRRAQAVFVRKEVLAAARQLAEAAGLKLAGVTPRPFVAGRLLSAAGVQQPAAVVTSWPGGGEFTVVADNRVRFTRPLTTGPDNLAGEVRRNLAVYAGQNPDAPLTALAVADAGGGAAGQLSSLPVTVRAFDPAAGVPGGELIAPSLRGRLAGPLALLADRAATDALPVNFAQPRAPRAEPSKNRGRLLIGGLAALLLVGMIGLFAYLQLDAAESRLAQRRAEKKSLQDQIDKLQFDVNRLKAVDEFAAREVVVIDELFEMANKVSDVKKLTVVDFDITAAKALTTAKKGPAPTGGAGTASSPPKAPPPVVAGLKATIRSSDGELVTQIADKYARDKLYYGKVFKTVKPANEAGAKTVEYVLTADLVHRPADKYTSRLSVVAPPQPQAVPANPDAGEGF